MYENIILNLAMLHLSKAGAEEVWSANVTDRMMKPSVVFAAAVMSLTLQTTEENARGLMALEYNIIHVM